MMLNHHPAPGLGDLLPGFFVVPQNPITDTQGTTYVPRIGEILPASYAVPQNPIKDYMSGQCQPDRPRTRCPRESQRESISCGCGVGDVRRLAAGLGISPRIWPKSPPTSPRGITRRFSQTRCLASPCGPLPRGWGSCSSWVGRNTPIITVPGGLQVRHGRHTLRARQRNKREDK